MELNELMEKLQIDLPQSSTPTLAELLIDRAHEIPAAGSTIKINDLSFYRLHSSPQRIIEVRTQW